MGESIRYDEALLGSFFSIRVYWGGSTSLWWVAHQAYGREFRELERTLQPFRQFLVIWRPHLRDSLDFYLTLLTGYKVAWDPETGS